MYTRHRRIISQVSLPPGTIVIYGLVQSKPPSFNARWQDAQGGLSEVVAYTGQNAIIIIQIQPYVE